MARERVLKVIESVLGPEVEGDRANLDLGSMKMLELVVAIEQEFGIQIPDDAPIVHIMTSVDSIVAYIEKHGVG